MSAPWRPGETIPVRYVQRGIVRYAAASRVIEDGPDRTILFQPMGSLAQFSRIDFEAGTIEGPQPHVWHTTDVLRIFEPGALHSVSLMYRGGGGPLLCWYVDFIDPVRRAGGGLVTWDQSLDIVVAPNLRWQWKDEDHFAHIQRLGWITPEKAAAIRRDGEGVAAKIESRASPFNEDWPAWRPDPAWQLPVLPDDWAVAPA